MQKDDQFAEKTEGLWKKKEGMMEREREPLGTAASVSDMGFGFPKPP